MFQKRMIVLLAAFFIILPPLLAFAGVIELPQTGQTKCYDTAGIEIACTGTGQDGEIRAGVLWPNPRFTVDGDCVTDNLTGLMWARNGNLAGSYMSWHSAVDYANNLTLCGYSDWRLPNVNELESLVNADVSNTDAWLNTQGFYNVQLDVYWSSTHVAGSTYYKWVVYIWFGSVDSDSTGNGYVWPVRSGQVDGSFGYSEIWKTGQTISYYTSDDGDLERGIAWPVPRFTDNSNGTVTDNLTGLVWLKDTNCINTKYPSFDNDYTFGDGRVTWQNALDFIKGINNGTYIDCGAAYSDWRVPNRKELRSLIDYSNYIPALPVGHPFTNVQSYEYWSSTTAAGYAALAWAVDMWGSYVYGGYKDFSYYYIWPVRSGQVGGSFDYYCDDDNDTYIDSSIDGTCTGSGCVPLGCQTTQGNDCDDSDVSINPGATEACNGVDDNCDNLIDENGVCDLIVSSWTAPANACAGATISIKDTTKNQGTGLAGASTTKFYFSTNTTLDAGDTPLGSRAVPSLNPAAISTGTTSVTFPNVAIGKYYLIAMADDGKVVPETNETNNKKSKAIYIGPDLIVSTLTAPTSAARGTTISIGDTTKNKGCGTAGASTTKFYLSTNTTINIGVDYELGTRPVPALGTNAISTGTTSVVIPAGISTGKYYIIANSDDGKVVAEGNETNNKKTKVITIQ